MEIKRTGDKAPDATHPALVMARSWLEFRREAWLEGDFWLLGLEQAVSMDE